MRHFKEYLIFTLLLSIFVCLAAQTQEWAWAQVAGGSDTDYAEGVATDTQGNSYATGSFTGTANFGTTVLTSIGSEDIFVAKVDSHGNWIWAISAGGIDSDYSYSIVVDPNNNVYVTGCYAQTAFFGSITIQSHGASDMFVAKISNTGVWQWVRRAGSYSSDSGSGIALDTSSNIYVCGFFQHSVQFGTTELESYGSLDVFVAKLDNNGNWVWTKSAGGEDSDIGYQLAVDANANIYLAGQIGYDAHFGQISVSSSGQGDIFAAKLDSYGNWVWVRSANGNGGDDRATGIALDVNANVYITGQIWGNVTFGTQTLYSHGGYDIFAAKLDSNGNWIWAVSAGGSSNDCGYSIAVGMDNKVCLTGRFISHAVFGNTVVDGNGLFDIFVWIMDSSGNMVAIKTAEGSGNVYSHCICVDDNNCISIAGFVSGTALFGNHTVVSSGSMDVMVASLKFLSATPTFDPPQGSYTNSLDVSINSATDGAIIYYTLDNSLPTHLSPIYTTPIHIDDTTTIKAIAMHQDYPESNIATATYQINITGLSPIFTPVSGTYPNAIIVTLTYPHPDSQIRYTLDGTEPNTSSALYSAPIYIESTTTIRAKAYEPDCVPSGTSVALYTITGTVATPVVSPPSGTYSSPQWVAFFCPTPGTSFRYTLDGTEPNASSHLYASPILINSSKTLKVKGYLTGWIPSFITTATYTITGTVNSPTFSLPGGLYTSAVNISLTSSNPGAYIRYTLDGTDPSTYSTLYTLPINLEHYTTTVKARAYLPGWTPSSVAVATYIVTGTVATPVFNPPAGVVETNQGITLSSSTWGAQIRYTLDGTNPILSSPLYTAPILISIATSIKAKAYLTDWEPSAISSASYQTPVSTIDELQTPEPGIVEIYPNPFSASTTIALNNKEPNQNYQIKIFNIKGECVFSRDGVANGKQSFIWNGNDKNSKRVASGLYLLKYTAAKKSIMRKIVLL
ncbi:MAG: chitobiase/beta-hexosaminidase C-terminal domain-containing protein [Candidatus Cloacimonetes bacterium]|nr:chitobiase/beta-hexosaminidase C-terminal domain-containing protein [Candidatus Cloacimonadota bacterium]